MLGLETTAKIAASLTSLGFAAAAVNNQWEKAL
jgi:hypothetical protein